MMLDQLQTYLAKTKRYAGDIDGKPGRLSDGGIMLAMTDGPDTRLADADFAASAQRLKVQTATIKAFWKVESNGVPFVNGRAPILPEPHRFSKLTNGFFDKQFPNLSFPKWNRNWYPADQDDRWDVILQWYRMLARAGMPIDAAFAAVSYGGPQILGENYKACRFTDPFSMAEAMARDEKTQLGAFEGFVTANGILPFLQKVRARDGAEQEAIQRAMAKYNGTAFKLNKYDIKFFSAFLSFGGK